MVILDVIDATCSSLDEVVRGQDFRGCVDTGLGAPARAVCHRRRNFGRTVGRRIREISWVGHQS